MLGATLFGQIIDFTKSYNFELASLWDVKDLPKIERHFDIMESYAQGIKISLAVGNRQHAMKLMEEKSLIEQKFDDKLARFHEDQKCSLSFNDNGIHDFEPLQVTPQKNTVLLKGLSLMLSYFAYNSNATVSGYSIGTGTGNVFPFQEALEAEKERVFITEGGKGSTGNYLRYSIQFSPALPSDTYSEFGLEMYMNAPPALARTVIQDNSKKLKHESGNTFVMGSHYLIFIPQ